MSAAWVRVLRGMIERGTCDLDLINAAQNNRGVITSDEAEKLRDYWNEKNPPPVTSAADDEPAADEATTGG